jgi:glycosyltransferase involved in cell wall biosynthesis
MRLTVLSVSYPLAQVSPKTAGGAEQVLATLDQALVEAGQRSLVIAPAGSRCQGLLIPAQIPTGILDESAKRQARRAFKQLLQRTLKDYSVDLVHMHGLDFYEYLPEKELPIVVSLHLPLSWYAPEALRWVRANVTLVCVSRAQRALAPGDARLRVIANGVNLARFRPAREKSAYLVAIARVCPEKGLHLAIDAAERAGVELVIAGSVFEYPEHRDYFESMIRPRLKKEIRFIGPVGGLPKAKLLAGARCLLAPSLAPETSSLAAMEAMASGTPVIAFASGALEEMVTPGRTGFLVGTVEEMAERIAQADSLRPSVCREEAERRFSGERMFAEYFDLYRALAGVRPRPGLAAA